ncbi:MAG: FHA domain-containing protein [Candidatus Eremiobacteraeota bacterium]|nr:FHA domain-containing protein [Candidatus Eremiobacteraeota bacterium]
MYSLVTGSVKMAVGEKPLMIGRAPLNDLICEDETASRLHAEVKLVDQKLVVRDLDSTNGTKLDGQPLAPGAWHPIKPGQVLSIGAWSVRVALADDTEAANPGPVPFENPDQDPSGRLPAPLRATRERALPEGLEFD